MSRFEFPITKEYLVFPISSYVKVRKIEFYCGNDMVDDIDIKLDYVNPEYNIYYPVAQYIGKNLILEMAANIEVQNIQTDTPDYGHTMNCAFRPYIHFTADDGWLNDPNGLVEYTSPVSGQKTYHMYFQHNPYGIVWNNMHWGHAVSSDLVSWKQVDNVLCPDEHGTIFSGSAIIDYNNCSGLKEGDENVILYFYTSAGGANLLSEGKRFAQCLAYSVDGGMSFRKYNKNPIIPHIVDDNRDPKVVWCDEMKCFVMALYLTGSKYMLMTSKNLIDWEKLQEIIIEGDEECPDIYPLCVNGGASDKKWVMTGALGKYIVCECTGKDFKVIQESRPLNYGAFSYAPQTFSNVSDGRRIRMAWNRDVSFPNSPFAQQMSIPYKMLLKKNSYGYFLCAEPVEEIKELAERTDIYEKVKIDEYKCFSAPVQKGAYDIEIDVMEDRIEKMQIGIFDCYIEIDAQNNTISMGEYIVPLSVMGERAKIRIIIDKCNMELITSDGMATMTVAVLCDYNLNTMTIKSTNRTIINRISITKLKNVFEH